MGIMFWVTHELKRKKRFMKTKKENRFILNNTFYFIIHKAFILVQLDIQKHGRRSFIGKTAVRLVDEHEVVQRHSTFSLMKYNKSRHRSNLSDEHLSALLRIATSGIQCTCSSPSEA
jgi:hypothetical protein